MQNLLAVRDIYDMDGDTAAVAATDAALADLGYTV